MAMLAVPLLTPLMGAAAAGTVGSVLTIGSFAMQGLSLFQGMREANAQAKAVRQEGAYQAASARQKAGQEIAVSQREALETKRKGDLTISRARALGAAGGGGSDVSVVNAIGDLAGQTEYNQLMDLYQGKERAAGLQQGADLAVYQANNEARAIKAKAKSKMFEGAISLLGSPIAGESATAGKSLYEKYAPKSMFSGGLVSPNLLKGAYSSLGGGY